MDEETICLEVEPITDTQWDILHTENACCDIKRVPVHLTESTSLASFDEYITENHSEYSYSFFIISNKKTKEDNVFLMVERGSLANFRCNVKAVWIVLANLTICNMDFEEYVEWANGEIFTEEM